MNSGYAYESNLAYQSKMIEVAEKRRDCFALLDIPQTTASKYENVIDWRKNISGFNTYRAALTTPWVKTYDSVQGRAGFIMCPSAFIAKLIGQAGDPWHAPPSAGSGRSPGDRPLPAARGLFPPEPRRAANRSQRQIRCRRLPAPDLLRLFYHVTEEMIFPGAGNYMLPGNMPRQLPSLQA